ncbi:MAG TPA: ATP-dependent RNA helicase HrpA, partial [Pseudomonas sp.]|nr:ATP-dependent RNA helicase HrpA [Pseudomonas sp.]
ALLTGLLSHIGLKDAEKQEFSGARNARFAIFPGSALFKKPPKWTMVAELVETSRLWGRIAARIYPEWIEPLAQHLIKRSYSEPHWEKAQGAVMAMEKVTLYGLPIVSARKVNYGPIDPQLSRELFIRHALVEGDWQTRHAFFKANQKLRSEVEDLEHKSRRRDILVDDETLFAFYDSRVGHEVVSARHFDSWWKKVSQQTPDLLSFDKEMLIKEGADKISKLDYPNFWHQGNLKLRLSYQFEPGADADGVTVHIPLPLLNQVEEAGFEWQIPGLRRELIIALIKSLPKPVRRNFVPAPNYAEAFLGRVTGTETPLLDALEREFRRMTGVTIDRDAWQWDQVPDHLKITFRVLDEHNRKLKEGKDLAALKASLKGKVQETLSKVADDGLEQSGLHIWSFGDLPAQFEQKRGNYSVKAWPALVDEKDSVAIRLFDSQHEQQKMMWRGQRRLLLLNIPSPIKYLHEKLPNKAKLGLYFNPYGKVLELIMTAPMVVAHWINLQYFTSTTDNLRFGSGNKLLHNVVGGHIGVFEGNGGDLRIGLARQSLHDGQQWMHRPLRLHVVIEAPRAMIDQVIANHAVVRDLVRNGWLHLLRLDGLPARLELRTAGGWQPLPEV